MVHFWSHICFFVGHRQECALFPFTMENHNGFLPTIDLKLQVYVWILWSLQFWFERHTAQLLWCSDNRNDTPRRWCRSIPSKFSPGLLPTSTYRADKNVLNFNIGWKFCLIFVAMHLYWGRLLPNHEPMSAIDDSIGSYWTQSGETHFPTSLANCSRNHTINWGSVRDLFQAFSEWSNLFSVV
jgi:hypothetical protein